MNFLNFRYVCGVIFYTALVISILVWNGALHNNISTSSLGTHKRNCIVFSIYLYADSRNTDDQREAKYLNGLMLNLEYAPYFYPGFDILIYADASLNETYLRHLETWHQWFPSPPAEKNNITIIRVISNTTTPYVGSLWKFYAIDDTDCDVLLFRDADGIFTPREVRAVNEWLESGTLAHTIHDHPGNHGGRWPYLAGSTAFRMEAFDPFREEYSSFTDYFLNLSNTTRFSDQVFLKWMWLRTNHSYIAHASMNVPGTDQNCTPFPTPRVHPGEWACKQIVYWWCAWKGLSISRVAQCHINSNFTTG